jgi:D-amino-acid dehydrogenase
MGKGVQASEASDICGGEMLVTRQTAALRSSGSRHAVVVGGGIAGLTVAYSLQRRDFAVTVIDARRVGAGASWGNAGWICPAQAGPLPEPGLVNYAIRECFRRDSPLYISPRYLPRALPWLVSFASRCNIRDYTAGVGALWELGARAFDFVEHILQDGVQFSVNRQGLIAVARDEHVAKRWLGKLDIARRHGFSVSAKLIQRDELLEIEPALSEAAGAGVCIDEHWHVVPSEMTSALAGAIVSRGATLVEHTRADTFEITGNRIRALRLTSDLLHADVVVLATGAETPLILRTLGRRLPMIAGKGYSFTVELEPLPRHALLFLEPHVGCSPAGTTLRVAGTMELSGLSTRVDSRRIRSMQASVQPLLRGWNTNQISNAWAGLRPIAPDGLPIIDRIPGLSNVYLATGYSMLGMTIAGPAAELLADLIVTGRKPPELVPFSTARLVQRTSRLTRSGSG